MYFERIEKPRTLVATPALAAEFNRMETLILDRPHSETRIMVYRRILAAGEFRPVTWASAYCEETGGIYRVNGWHTSELLMTTTPFPRDFYVTVERYRLPPTAARRSWPT